MTDTTDAARARNLVKAMTLNEKAAYLRSRNWRRIDGDRWEAANGIQASLANAVRLQVLADLDAP
jgi:hypothetical protein